MWVVLLPAETIGKPDELILVIQRYHGFENDFKKRKVIFKRKIKASQAI